MRRASINSFGFGGANSHIVIDDAHNYLRLRSLRGLVAPKFLSFAPVSRVRRQVVNNLTNGDHSNGDHSNGHSNGLTNGDHSNDHSNGLTNGHSNSLSNGLTNSHHSNGHSNGHGSGLANRLSHSTGRFTDQEQRSRLLVWSASDKDGIGRLGQAYESWYLDHKDAIVGLEDDDMLRHLAYILSNHRSRLRWRSFAVLSSSGDMESLRTKLSQPVEAAAEPPRLGFVFTGQGAQWFAMGRELLCYASFERELEAASAYLETLGCQWSAIGACVLCSVSCVLCPVSWPLAPSSIGYFFFFDP